jgi:preprotein translocase subunit SecG
MNVSAGTNLQNAWIKAEKAGMEGGTELRSRLPNRGAPPYSQPLMDILIGILTVVEVIVCLLLILIVLMQRPRQEGLGASFGDSAMTQLVGAQTTNVLQKGTVYLAVTLFVLTLSLAVLTTRKQVSKAGTKVFEAPPPPPAAPATPAPAAATPAAATPAAKKAAADEKKAPAPAAAPAPAKKDDKAGAAKTEAPKPSPAPAAPAMKEPVEAKPAAAPASAAPATEQKKP